MNNDYDLIDESKIDSVDYHFIQDFKLYLGENLQKRQIKIQNGRIVKIDLWHEKKRGNFPENIGDLTELLILNLVNIDLKNLPDSIGKLLNLEEMNISSNHHIRLLDSIGNLTRLKKLNMSRCNLTELPKSFGNLLNLECLNLEFNNLNQLPNNFGNLQKLEILDCENNKLTTLPDSFFRLKNLSRLNLRNNPLKVLSNEIINFINYRKSLNPEKWMICQYCKRTITNFERKGSEPWCISCGLDDVNVYNEYGFNLPPNLLKDENSLSTKGIKICMYCGGPADYFCPKCQKNAICEFEGDSYCPYCGTEGQWEEIIK